MFSRYSATWRGSLDAFCAVLPLTLGSSVLLYAMIAPEYLGAGVLAGLLGLVCIHLTTARASRPVYYSARFFEAATIGTMVQKLGEMLPAAGLENSSEARLALLISILVLSALVVGVLWFLKAQRLARFVPAPVYTGFVNTIAVAVLFTQAQSLIQQATESQVAWMPLAVAALVLALSLGILKWRPKWSASSLGLLIGLILAMAIDWDRQVLPRVFDHSEWMIPTPYAHFSLWLTAPGPLLEVVGWLLVNAVMVGTLMFLSTVSAGQLLTQTDDRETIRATDGWREAGGLLAAGLLGSAPLSGSHTAAIAGSRHGPIKANSLRLLSLLALGVIASQVLVWMPLAAITAIMLFDAWNMWNRESAQRAWSWMRGKGLSTQIKEDTLLIGSVMAASLLLNMVAGLLLGLGLGLLLHAHRSTRQPVRNIWTGQHIASSCARSRAELILLGQHGQDLRVFQLDAQQFFASAALLNQTIRNQSEGAFCVILDWSRVNHIDSSVALVVARLDTYLKGKGLLVWHADTQRNGEEVHQILNQYLQKPQWSPDLDRALEKAENHLLEHYNPALASSFEESAPPSWLNRLPVELRSPLAACLTTGLFAPGEVILREGDPSDCLWLLTHGRASVYLRHKQPNEIRIGGAGPGTTVGEMGFLDGSNRSATVVAESQVEAMRLSRSDFDALSVEHPAIIQHLLTYLTTEISARLRYANQKKLYQ